MLVVHFIKERAGQVGRAPFAGAGVLIELPEGIPMFGLYLVTGQRLDRAAKGLGCGAFLADGLAFARRKAGEEIIETLCSLGFPNEIAG